MKIRERNKQEGRLCGNCAFAGECSDNRKVNCKNPNVPKPNQNEANWYRKTKGGCVFWQEGEGHPCQTILENRAVPASAPCG